MKKVILILCSVLILVACGSKEENDNKGKVNISEEKSNNEKNNNPEDKKLESNQNDSKSSLRDYEVTIGNQVWMTKNLNVDKFRNGDVIPEAKSEEEWKKAGEEGKPAWCYYENDPANGAKYGKLYNWYAVNDLRGLAPEGYHVPTNDEWTVLIDYLGGGEVAGKKMKSKSGWDSYTTGGSKTCPNCVNWNAEYRRKVPCHTCQDTRSVPAPMVTNSGNGTNTSAFSGLPGGVRSFNVPLPTIGSGGYWWSSTEVGTNNAWAWYRYMQNYEDLAGRYYFDLQDGLSVRCLRD